MKKWLKEYLKNVPTLNAWQREDIASDVEAMYQAKRREIITQTFIATVIGMTVIASIIVGYLT